MGDMHLTICPGCHRTLRWCRHGFATTHDLSIGIYFILPHVHPGHSGSMADIYDIRENTSQLRTLRIWYRSLRVMMG